MFKKKSNNKSEGPETILVLHFGLETIKFYKELMTGDGDNKDTKLTTKDYLKH